MAAKKKSTRTLVFVVLGVSIVLGFVLDRMFGGSASSLVFPLTQVAGACVIALIFWLDGRGESRS